MCTYVFVCVCVRERERFAGSRYKVTVIIIVLGKQALFSKAQILHISIELGIKVIII